jgi:hypothetical protein
MLLFFTPVRAKIDQINQCEWNQSDFARAGVVVQTIAVSTETLPVSLVIRKRNRS